MWLDYGRLCSFCGWWSGAVVVRGGALRLVMIDRSVSVTRSSDDRVALWSSEADAQLCASSSNEQH